jgi:hypothetical protein
MIFSVSSFYTLCKKKLLSCGKYLKALVARTWDYKLPVCCYRTVLSTCVWVCVVLERKKEIFTRLMCRREDNKEEVCKWIRGEDVRGFHGA